MIGLFACAEPAPELPGPAPHRRSARVSPAVPEDEALTAARGTLVALVARAHDARPWMLAHAVLAEGPTPTLLGPLFAAARPGPGFAREPGHETHTDLVLKNLLEAGADPARRWDTPQGPTTVTELWRAALRRATLDPARQLSSWTSPADMAWSLQAFADGAPGRPFRWTSADGAEMDLDLLTAFVARFADQQTAFLEEERRRGVFERAGQPLFELPCGGQHVVQGLGWAVAEGFGGDAAAVEAREQGELLLWRIPRELAQVEAIRQARPDAEATLRLQELKLLGHGLETVGKLRAQGVMGSDEAVAAQTAGMAAALAAVVARLPEDVGDDGLGDAAHALRGLDLVTGRVALEW